jgi:hypothetical protein
MVGVGAANRFGADLGEPDVTDVACPHHLPDRPHRLLDRNVGEHPARSVDIDVVGTEPAQRVGEEVLDRGRTQVVADDGPVGAAHEQPIGVTEGPDGAVWFAEFAGNKIGRLDLDSLGAG